MQPVWTLCVVVVSSVAQQGLVLVPQQVEDRFAETTR